MLRMNAVVAGKKVDIVIDEKNVKGITEKPQPTTKLFDEGGNLVSETPTESLYKVHFEGGAEILIEKSVFEKLVKKLAIETL